MYRELCQYLVTDIAEWLMTNILQQPIVLSELDLNHHRHRTLYISPDYHFLYAWYRFEFEIRKYNLFKQEEIQYIVMKNIKEGIPFMQSLQHPQWIGFIVCNKYIYLIDITTGDLIHMWTDTANDRIIRHHVNYTWDENLGLLIPLRCHHMSTVANSTLKDIQNNSIQKYPYSRLYEFIGYFLKREETIIGKFFDFRSDEVYTPDTTDINLFNNITYVFHAYDEDEIKIEYSCPHVIHLYSNNDICVQKNCLIVKGCSIVQLYPSTNKRCTCR